MAQLQRYLAGQPLDEHFAGKFPLVAVGLLPVVAGLLQLVVVELLPVVAVELLPVVAVGLLEELQKRLQEVLAKLAAHSQALHAAVAGQADHRKTFASPGETLHTAPETPEQVAMLAGKAALFGLRTTMASGCLSADV